jgi:NAD(P)-dependent dehydrogenase (short-subunit alcohol dehydrogenase family)
MRDLEFAGLAALVTGGGSGIGLATARMLHDRGARVACVDVDVSAVPDPLLAVRGDVGEDTIAHAVADAADRLGGIDVLVNNAGVLARGTVEDNDIAEWQRVYNVNVFGMVRVTRAALPWLRRSAQAAIVNTCSLGATVGLPAAAVYTSSKGAVYALTLAMAADHLREGIRVNCVTPAPVDTPWVRRIIAAAADPDQALADVNARQPNGRLVTADEVASAICYLAGPSAGATTGTSLAVDGGTRGVLVRPQQTAVAVPAAH